MVVYKIDGEIVPHARSLGNSIYCTEQIKGFNCSVRAMIIISTR